MNYSLNKILSIIAIIFVIELIGYIGINYFNVLSHFETPQAPIVQVTQTNTDTITQPVLDTSSTKATKDVNKTEQNIKPNITQKYTNEKYGYEISYPKDWDADAEYSIVDSTNKLLSIKAFFNANKSNKVSITVNEKEWLLKYEALEKDEIIIGDTVFTAYVFPYGYECFGQELDCSFFVVPIFKNGLWYEIRGKGNVDNVISSDYKDIISTFRFTDI